ncbi:MAG: RNA 3'-terminal phosphate cyclase [Capsulimonadaceae bacterium]
MCTGRVRIDGSLGEGGGQVIRTSLSLSVLTGEPVEIVHVRARRARPGLQPQHLMAVQAAARICDAEVDGASVGAREFTFTPGSPPQPGVYRFDIGTAGATALVMQTVLVPLALCDSDSRVTVLGGTHVPHAPTAQYLEHVYGRVLEQHGLNSTVSSTAAGFFPRGGGTLDAHILPGWPTGVDLTARGRLQRLTAHIVTSGLPSNVAGRGAAACVKALSGFRKPVVVETDLPSRGQGAAVVIVAECDEVATGFSAIGERGKPMETVAREACDEFAAWYRTGTACDPHLADQLALPMSLVAGTSRWTTSTVTEHLRTVLEIVLQFLPVEAALDERPDGAGLVTLRGVPPSDLRRRQ